MDCRATKVEIWLLEIPPNSDPMVLVTRHEKNLTDQKGNIRGKLIAFLVFT